MPEEGAKLPPRCDASSATKSDSKDNSSSRALNVERPKRSVGWIHHYQQFVVYCFVFLYKFTSVDTQETSACFIHLVKEYQYSGI